MLTDRALHIRGKNWNWPSSLLQMIMIGASVPCSYIYFTSLIINHVNFLLRLTLNLLKARITKINSFFDRSRASLFSTPWETDLNQVYIWYYSDLSGYYTYEKNNESCGQYELQWKLYRAGNIWGFAWDRSLEKIKKKKKAVRACKFLEIINKAVSHDG